MRVRLGTVIEVTPEQRAAAEAQAKADAERWAKEHPGGTIWDAFKPTDGRGLTIAPQVQDPNCPQGYSLRSSGQCCKPVFSVSTNTQSGMIMSGPPRDECVPGPARPQQSFFQRWEMPILGTLGVGVAALVYFSFKGGRR